jgi:hypothetical protein
MATGTWVSSSSRSAKPRSSAPPPATVIPLEVMSEASSGGVSSRVALAASTISATGASIAWRMSSLVT